MKQYSYFQGKVRPKVYSLQAKSDLPPVFVNKVLLKHNHAYLVYILCMAAAFILYGRVEYLLLLIWPTMPKIITICLFTESLLTPAWSRLLLIGM